MKFSIHGFCQPRAVELGLTNDDLLVLRWFVDFAGTKKMKTIIENDGIYYWVNYSTVLDDLPVLKISKVTLKRKHFDKLCEVHVLKHKHIKQGGSFSYYAYGINYDTLVYLQDSTPSKNLDNPSTKLDEGYDEKVQTPSTKLDYPYDEKVQTKINLLNNTSINNQSIKETNKETTTKFKKPTLEQVKAYCLERKNSIDAESFIDYYEANGWKVGRNSMKDWKAAVRTWEKRGTKANKPIKNEWFDKNIKKEELSQEEEEEMKSILNKY